MDDINQTDKSLKKGSAAGAVENDELPPIRSSASSEVPTSKVGMLLTVLQIEN